MKIKGLKDEDFVNYKKPSMFIGTAKCDWKCCKEQNLDISMCQNSNLSNAKILDVPADEIYRRYITNPITKAVVIGGLEPFLQFDELLDVIKVFRDSGCVDDIVIYTGYYPYELMNELDKLKEYNNIIIKYGRYIPNHIKRFDKVLGVCLASDNQYAQRL